MLRKTSLGLFSIAALAFLGFGCATKGYVTKQMTPVQSQLSVMTEEMVRLDSSIQEMKGSQGRGAAWEGGAPSGSASGIYRTPSGFELPSVNIQQALKNAGYYQGSLDGKIGPATEAALRSFQRDNGLGADGVCGRQTWQRLKVYLSTTK